MLILICLNVVLAALGVFVLAWRLLWSHKYTRASNEAIDYFSGYRRTFRWTGGCAMLLVLLYTGIGLLVTEGLATAAIGLGCSSAIVSVLWCASELILLADLNALAAAALRSALRGLDSKHLSLLRRDLQRWPRLHRLLFRLRRADRSAVEELLAKDVAPCAPPSGPWHQQP
jgi:hypothetical protein